MGVRGVRLLAAFALAAAVTLTVWLLVRWRTAQDLARITISTDRASYAAGDTVEVLILNSNRHAVDIYCPAWCALGNFPTQVERFEDGDWVPYLGFCPSIEPVFGSGELSGGMIRHRLSAGAAFELRLSAFESAAPPGGQRMRIVYQAGPFRLPVYSNEFSLQP